MDQSFSSTGTGERMQMRERRVREHSYHHMASDSDDAGGVSDGDPPFFAGPASVTGSTSGSVLAPGPRSTHPDSLVGAASTNPAAIASGNGGVVAALMQKKGKRSFEELEDIVFSNPKSFASLAFAIAESRGVTLVVSDDRTHKVTSAYMHITCAYRKAGCPFILKLTKAKEGGWVLKGAKALEGRAVDIKQRSIYRCRHPSGANPEVPLGTDVASYANAPSPAPGSTTSYPVSTTAGGGVSKPKAARPARASVSAGVSDFGGFEQYDSSIGKVSSLKNGAKPRASAPPAPIGGFNSPATTRMTAPASADRALAPPFERSINLQSRIAPVLNSNGFTIPRGSGITGSAGQGYLIPTESSPKGLAALLQQHVGGNSSSSGEERIAIYNPDEIPSTIHTVPIIAKSDPTALADWTRLLKALSPPSAVTASTMQDRSNATSTNTSPTPSTSSPSPSKAKPTFSSSPSLVPIAQVLAHPYMSITPSQFFDESTTIEMRTSVLNELPVDRVGVWNKVWISKVLLQDEAEKKWREICREKERKSEEMELLKRKNSQLDGTTDLDAAGEEDGEYELDEGGEEEESKVGVNNNSTSSVQDTTMNESEDLAVDHAQNNDEGDSLYAA